MMLPTKTTVTELPKLGFINFIFGFERAGLKRQRRRAGTLQSFARGRQKDFRLHPSRNITTF